MALSELAAGAGLNISTCHHLLATLIKWGYVAKAPGRRYALGARGLELAQVLFGDELAATLRRDSWRNLPILNEWRRLHPELDPVALHERVFHEYLACPGGGTYVWNEEWHTLESSIFGHPGAPQDGIRRPKAWDELSSARFALEFEADGLRVRAELERK